MQKNIINISDAPTAIGPYSQAIKARGFLFISGQIPLNIHGDIVGNDITAQTRQVLNNIMAIIKSANMIPLNTIKCSCFLKNMEDFTAFNTVYSEYFGSVLPTRECVEVSRLPKDVLIEISAICAE